MHRDIASEVPKFSAQPAAQKWYGFSTKLFMIYFEFNLHLFGETLSHTFLMKYEPRVNFNMIFYFSSSSRRRPSQQNLHKYITTTSQMQFHSCNYACYKNDSFLFLQLAIKGMSVALLIYLALNLQHKVCNRE